MRKHIEIGMRQFVYLKYDAMADTQNADTHWRGGDRYCS